MSPGCRCTSVLKLGNNMQLVEQMFTEVLTKLCLPAGQGCMVHHHGGQKGHSEEGAGPAARARRAKPAQHAVHARPHAALGPRLVLHTGAASEEEAARPGSASCRKARILDSSCTHLLQCALAPCLHREAYASGRTLYKCLIASLRKPSAWQSCRWCCAGPSYLSA